MTNYCQCAPEDKQIDEADPNYFYCSNCDKEVQMPDLIDTDLEYETYKELQMEENN